MDLINPGGNILSGSYAADLYANVALSGGTPTITKSSANVSGVTDRATGRWTIVHSAIASNEGSVGGSTEGSSGLFLIVDTNGVSKTTTATPVALVSTAGAFADQTFSMFVIGA